MEDKILEIVKRAGEIVKRGFGAKKNTDFKGKIDLVTQFDVEVEDFLKIELSKEFDGFTFLAEESSKSAQKSANMFIIDPIDGTTNFVHSLPFVSISLGLIQDDKLSFGVVYNPILEEMYVAKRSQGAFLNGVKLEVSKSDKLINSLIATGFPYSVNESLEDVEWNIHTLRKVLSKSRGIRRYGSAALDLCMVARGSFELFYEMNLNPWDVSAGILMIQEAGGHISNEHGSSFDMFSSNIIVASNGAVHKEMIDLLKGV